MILHPMQCRAYVPFLDLTSDHPTISVPVPSFIPRRIPPSARLVVLRVGVVRVSPFKSAEFGQLLDFAVGSQECCRSFPICRVESSNPQSDRVGRASIHGSLGAGRESSTRRSYIPLTKRPDDDSREEDDGGSNGKQPILRPFRAKFFAKRVIPRSRHGQRQM